MARLTELVNAFPNRVHAAAEEQQKRDDKSPEVILLGSAERIAFGISALSECHAQQKQTLICGIGDRMHALGKHGDAAGKSRGNEFSDRDGAVRSHRSDHRFFRVAVTGHRCDLSTEWVRAEEAK